MFYQWAGGTPHDHAMLAKFSQAVPEQMGQRLGRFTGGFTTSSLARTTFLCLIVCLVFIGMYALWSPRGVSWPVVGWTVFGVGVVFVYVIISFVFASRKYYHDVHRHGLVLYAPGTTRLEVIPWASIDPGKTFVGTTVRSGTRMPVALHRQRAVMPPAVMLNGWTNRPRGGDEVVETFSSGYRYQPRPIDSPFGWWQLGARNPGAFLAAIEAAMVADGYPATGLTRFALSRRVNTRDLRRNPDLQRERKLTDPLLGLPYDADRPPTIS